MKDPCFIWLSLPFSYPWGGRPRHTTPGFSSTDRSRVIQIRLFDATLVAGTSQSCIIQRSLSRPIYMQRKRMLTYIRYIISSMQDLLWGGSDLSPFRVNLALSIATTGPARPGLISLISIMTRYEEISQSVRRFEHRHMQELTDQAECLQCACQFPLRRLSCRWNSAKTVQLLVSIINMKGQPS